MHDLARETDLPCDSPLHRYGRIWLCNHAKHYLHRSVRPRGGSGGKDGGDRTGPASSV